MAIYKGNNKIGEVFAGGSKIKEVYKGNQLLYQGGKHSYVILTNNTRIDFEMENTPIANFCSYGSGVISINGVNVNKSYVKDLVFGSSYASVTNIPGSFLHYCSALTSIDLSEFANVASIDYGAFRDCHSLPSIDLGVFPKITSINHSFCMQASSLAAINVRGVSESKITDEYNQSFQGVASVGVVYADTLSIGNGYKQRFYSLQNWTVIVN